MGWIKDAKADAMLKDAQAAWDEGSPVFTPILNTPLLRSGASGRIKDWEQMLDAIFSVGWRLQQWAVTVDKDNRPQAMPIFTR